MTRRERSIQAVVASLLVGFAPWVWQQFLTDHPYRFAAGVLTIAFLAALYFWADDIRQRKAVAQLVDDVDVTELQNAVDDAAAAVREKTGGGDGS